MLVYALRRILYLIPVVVGVSIVSFALLRFIPGDPAVVLAGVGATQADLDGIRQEYGLDQPLPVQYLTYVSHALQGDLGISIRTRDPVARTLFTRLQLTIQLTLASMALATTLGIFAGVMAATHHNSWLDTGIMVTSLAGISLPGFWLGLLLLVVFAGMLHWLPAGGSGTPQHLILPAIVLGASGAAVIARMTRASILDVIRQDYLRTLRANGVSEQLIIYKHALRNALNPVITVIGLEFGFLLGGAVTVESVFALPGVGMLMVNAIFNRDYPVVQGGMLVIASLFVLVNLFTDLVYGLVNPRIRY
ncbi:MAG: ABC transporter permease [Chloroflexi bacterium]|nr:ABC transporter permease [Chloroflexota bacterium]